MSTAARRAFLDRWHDVRAGVTDSSAIWNGAGEVIADALGLTDAAPTPAGDHRARLDAEERALNAEARAVKAEARVAELERQIARASEVLATARGETS